MVSPPCGFLAAGELDDERPDRPDGDEQLGQWTSLSAARARAASEALYRACPT
jgi:hypothetical protein